MICCTHKHRGEYIIYIHTILNIIICDECLTVCKCHHIVETKLPKGGLKILGLIGGIGGKIVMDNVVKELCSKEGINLDEVDTYFDKLDAARTLSDYYSTNNIPNEACFKSDEILPGVWLMKCIKSNYIVSSKGTVIA